MKIKKEELNKIKKIKKTAVAATLGIMILSLSGCGKKYEQQPNSIDLIYENCDDTYLDELEDYQTASGDENDIYSKIELLTNYVNLSNELDQVKKYDITNLSDEEKTKVENLTREEQKLLLESYNELNGSGAKRIQKDQVGCELNYLKTLCDSWFEENGLNLSESILLITLKSGICGALELGQEEYSNVRITANNKDNTALYAIYVDKKTGLEYTYELSDSGFFGNGVIYDAANLVCNMQHSEGEKLTIDKIKNYCNETIETLNLSIVSGIEIKDDTAEPIKNKKEANKVLKKS